MRFGNVLKMVGGVVETGRRVTLHVRYKQKGGLWTTQRCEATILPIGENERIAARHEARQFCIENPEYEVEAESAIQFISRFLHDPDDLRLKWVLGEELGQLRAGLVKQKVEYLLKEYEQHVQDQYPELAQPTTEESLKTEIARLQKQLAQMTSDALGE